MIKFYQAKNILIDGSSLAGSWLSRTLNTNTRGNMDASNYEAEMLGLLEKIAARKAGSAVIRAIQDAGERKGTELRIVPYTGKEGALATKVATRADSERDSTPHAIVPGFPAGTRGGGTRGTGRGSSSEIHISPRAVGGQYRPTCPQDGPVTDACTQRPMAPMKVDDILLHEMVHSLRQMEGLFNPLPIQQADYDGDEEEFFAILVQNIYISETGGALLRKDHGPFVLSDALSNSPGFLGKGKEPLTKDDEEGMNRRLVDKLVTLQGTFAAALARSPARFNPVREYLAHRGDYPLV